MSQSFRATQPSAAELDQVAALESDLATLTPIVFDELMPLSEANKLEAFQATFKEKAAPLFADAQEAADSLMAAENAAAAQELSHAQRAYAQAVVGLVVILLLGIAVALAARADDLAIDRRAVAGLGRDARAGRRG